MANFWRNLRWTTVMIFTPFPVSKPTITITSHILLCLSDLFQFYPLTSSPYRRQTHIISPNPAPLLRNHYYIFIRTDTPKQRTIILQVNLRKITYPRLADKMVLDIINTSYFMTLCIIQHKPPIPALQPPLSARYFILLPT